MSAPAKHVLKTPTAKDLDQMSSDELRKDLADLRQQQIGIKCRNAGFGVKMNEHPSGQARQTRVTIARIMTILVKRRERCV